MSKNYFIYRLEERKTLKKGSCFLPKLKHLGFHNLNFMNGLKRGAEVGKVTHLGVNGQHSGLLNRLVLVRIQQVGF